MFVMGSHTLVDTSSIAYSTRSSPLSCPSYRTLLLILLPLLLTTTGKANGYLVGRLLSLQNMADAHRQLLAAATTAGNRQMLDQSSPFVAIPPLQFPSMNFPQSNGDISSNEISTDEQRLMPHMLYATKKSSPFRDTISPAAFVSGYNALKKYNGNASRNCFFTPIQCMLQHDLSKYKKLVDSMSDSMLN